MNKIRALFEIRHQDIGCQYLAFCGIFFGQCSSDSVGREIFGPSKVGVFLNSDGQERIQYFSKKVVEIREHE